MPSYCSAVSPSGTYPADTAVDDARAAVTRAAGTATVRVNSREGEGDQLVDKDEQWCDLSRAGRCGKRTST